MENLARPVGKWGLIAGRAVLLALCGIAVTETTLHFVYKNRAPSPEQWDRLRSHVASAYHPGDLIAVAPRWAEPLARKALGDSMMPLSAVARADYDSFARVIEIGILGQKRSEFMAWPSVRHESIGKFDLSIRTNPSFRTVRFDAVEHVDPAALSVAIARGNGEEVCPFSETAPVTAGNLGGDPTSPHRRFLCPGGGIHWVGVTIIDDEQYRPRRCIWAPPSPLGQVILRFHRVPYGTRLIGHAGAPWLMVRDGVGPPISLTASTQGASLGLVTAKDTDGWIRFEWNTERLDNTVAELELRIAETHREQRFCLTLEAR